MLNILKKRAKNNGQELRDLLSGYQLPSFSSAVINVLGMLRDPESAMNDIAKQLEIDPGMHVKVLTTVNSAAFGLTTKVANIPHGAQGLPKISQRNCTPQPSLNPFPPAFFRISQCRC